MAENWPYVRKTMGRRGECADWPCTETHTNAHKLWKREYLSRSGITEKQEHPDAIKSVPQDTKSGPEGRISDSAGNKEDKGSKRRIEKESVGQDLAKFDD